MYVCEPPKMMIHELNTLLYIFFVYFSYESLSGYSRSSSLSYGSTFEMNWRECENNSRMLLYSEKYFNIFLSNDVQNIQSTGSWWNFSFLSNKASGSGAHKRYRFFYFFRLRWRRICHHSKTSRNKAVWRMFKSDEPSNEGADRRTRRAALSSRHQKSVWWLKSANANANANANGISTTKKSAGFTPFKMIKDCLKNVQKMWLMRRSFDKFRSDIHFNGR